MGDILPSYIILLIFFIFGPFSNDLLELNRLGAKKMIKK